MIIWTDNGLKAFNIQNVQKYAGNYVIIVMWGLNFNWTSGLLAQM